MVHFRKLAFVLNQLYDDTSRQSRCDNEWASDGYQLKPVAFTCQETMLSANACLHLLVSGYRWNDKP